MPRKYRASQMDYMFFCCASSIYGMVRPIEEKLKAGGYKGPFLADFDNEIYKKLGVIDEEATRKAREAESRRPGGNPDGIIPIAGPGI